MLPSTSETGPTGVRAAARVGNGGGIQTEQAVGLLGLKVEVMINSVEA